MYLPYSLCFSIGFDILLNMVPSYGKFLIIIGFFLVIVGVILSSNIQIPWFGKLPGDIYIKKDNFSFYFPVTTCILVSVVLTLIFYLLKK